MKNQIKIFFSMIVCFFISNQLFGKSFYATHESYFSKLQTNIILVKKAKSEVLKARALLLKMLHNNHKDFQKRKNQLFIDTIIRAAGFFKKINFYGFSNIINKHDSRGIYAISMPLGINNSRIVFNFFYYDYKKVFNDLDTLVSNSTHLVRKLGRISSLYERILIVLESLKNIGVRIGRDYNLLKSYFQHSNQHRRNFYLFRIKLILSKMIYLTNLHLHGTYNSCERKIANIKLLSLKGSLKNFMAVVQVENKNETRLFSRISYSLKGIEISTLETAQKTLVTLLRILKL